MRSYASGPSTRPLTGQTVGEALAATAARLPDGLAVVSRHQDVRLTWSELAAQVEDVARGLLAIGVEQGDRVGIWSPTRIEWTLLQFATARVGAILVNVNPAYRPQELAYALGQSGVRVLVTAPSFKTSDYVDRRVVEAHRNHPEGLILDCPGDRRFQLRHPVRPVGVCGPHQDDRVDVGKRFVHFPGQGVPRTDFPVVEPHIATDESELRAESP